MGTFGSKVHESVKLRPDQAFINHFELYFPKSTSTTYVDDFFRIQNYHKHLPNSERVSFQSNIGLCYNFK